MELAQIIVEPLILWFWVVTPWGFRAEVIWVHLLCYTYFTYLILSRQHFRVILSYFTPELIKIGIGHWVCNKICTRWNSRTSAYFPIWIELNDGKYNVNWPGIYACMNTCEQEQHMPCGTFTHEIDWTICQVEILRLSLEQSYFLQGRMSFEIILISDAKKILKLLSTQSVVWMWA